MTGRSRPGVTRRADGVLEKRTPHFDLALAKRSVSLHRERCFTYTARLGLTEMGLTSEEAIDAILEIDADTCFYKSMTSFNDVDLWQDVYHVQTTAGVAYVKLQTALPPKGTHATPKVVIQFKAK